MENRIDAFWKQKWFPWAFGLTVACVVTAVVLIIVLVPRGKKNDDKAKTEYRYNDYDYDYDSYDDFDYDRDDFYEEYDGTTSASSPDAVVEVEEPYEDWEAVTEDDLYGIEYDDMYDYEYIVSQFEWLCEYGDPAELQEFSDQFNDIDPSGFTDEQLNRLQIAAMKLAERYE